VAQIEALERNKLIQKVKRQYGLSPERIKRISRCSCGSPLFCVLLTDGSAVDSFYRFIHICSGISCASIQESGPLPLKTQPLGDLRCSFCKGKSDFNISERRRILNYNRFVSAR